MDFFKKIDSQFHNDLPFVVYRKPKEAIVKAIFQSDDLLHHLKTYAETGFVFAPFDSNREIILLHPDEILEFSGSIPQDMETKKDIKIPRLDKEDKASYIHLVEKAIDGITKGRFQKVVLSRRLEIDLETSPLNLFQRLLASYPNAFCYLWYHPKVGIWCGATPEILLRQRNSQLTTMSLAGTQPYLGVENPPWGHKEIEEQQLVTDYIADVLKNAVKHIRRTSVETVRAGNLLHLRTKISGNLITKNLKTIVEVLHPTPAVCGLPKETALAFISDNENYDREYYTGFLGELNLKTEQQRSSRRKNQENQAYRSVAKTTTLYVNLRCLQIKDDKALIYVGGGITKDSHAEREWGETVTKSSTMLKIL